MKSLQVKAQENRATGLGFVGELSRAKHLRMTLRKADKKGRPESVAELSNQFCLLLPIIATD